MKYTKEQAEMLVLIVLMGCAVLVLSFLYLVKPNFDTIVEKGRKLKETEEKRDKLRKVVRALGDANKDREMLTEIISRGEDAVTRGLKTIPTPLFTVLLEVVDKVGLKYDWLEPGRPKPPLVTYRERGEDGIMERLHYEEVVRILHFDSTVDFRDFWRFVRAVENANAGLRVTRLEIDNDKVTSEERDAGKVTGSVDVTMLGIRQGAPKNIVVGPPREFEGRNPFGPMRGTTDDVKKDEIMAVLKRIKVRGFWSDELTMEVPVSGSTTKSATKTVRIGDTFVAEGWKIKYVLRRAADSSLVFEAVDDGKRYRIFRNYKGQVIKVIEINVIEEEGAK